MLQYLLELRGWGAFADSPRGIFARDLAAALTALFASIGFGRWFIRSQVARRRLERADISDSSRLNDLHRGKSQTPTMGGFIFLLPLAGAVLLWGRLDERFTWILLLSTLALALLGFVDDLVKMRGRRKGLSARGKLACQALVGAAAGVYLYLYPLLPDRGAGTALSIPFAGGLALPLGMLFIPLAGLVITGSSNAVNLTDGLDGLAMGCSLCAAFTLAVLAAASGLPGSEWLALPHIPGSLEVSVFAAALTGAGLGFLWFNCHPAQVFMGDTGALPLGGALGLMAVLLKQEFLFLLVGGVFVAEAMSVILQVASFKLCGKRIFLIAPLHHHFQFKGWSEAKVTIRFWIVAALLAVASLAAVRLG